MEAPDHNSKDCWTRFFLTVTHWAPTLLLYNRLQDEHSVTTHPEGSSARELAPTKCHVLE